MSKPVKLLFFSFGIAMLSVACFQVFNNEINSSVKVNHDVKLEENANSSLNTVDIEEEDPVSEADIKNLANISTANLKQAPMFNEPVLKQINNVEGYRELVKRLTSNGLSQEVSSQLFVRDDYVGIINSLEKTNNQSFEVQQLYVDLIEQAIYSGHLDMTVNAFNCNDKVCGGALSYLNDEQISSFVEETFNNKKSLPVAYKIQPIVQNGIKELRILFNYKNPAIEVSLDN